MCIEERFEQLEKENTELRNRVETLERKGGDIFVTVKELAEIMKCPAIRSTKKYAVERFLQREKQEVLKSPSHNSTNRRK